MGGILAASHRVLRAAKDHDLTGRAAEAAFFAALALLPSVLTLVAVLRAERPAFAGDAAPRVSADLARLLRVVLTTRGGVAADSADSLLSTPSRGLLGIGTVVAVLVLARGMRSIQRSLTIISGVPARNPRREWIRAVVLAVTVLALASVLLAAFTLGPLLGHARQVGGDPADTVLQTVWVWLRWPVSVLMVFFMATLLLAQESPRRPRRWRANAPGAVLTVLGWSAATGLLPIYVALAAHFSPTLGSLGGGLIVLV
ncbi:MAG: YhjD/YihY/BrkB family envelope integrity protein, partial [Jatrophihabitantaceae bacterium]